MSRGRPVGSYKGIYPTRVGGKRTKTWNAYVAMIQRCTNVSSLKAVAGNKKPGVKFPGIDERVRTRGALIRGSGDSEQAA